MFLFISLLSFFFLPPLLEEAIGTEKDNEMIGLILALCYCLALLILLVLYLSVKGQTASSIIKSRPGEDRKVP